MTTIEQLQKLEAIEPAEPKGWFCWLHNHYLVRYGDMHLGLTFGDYYTKDWAQVSDNPIPLCEQVDNEELLTSFLNRHAWMAGMQQLFPTVDKYWEQLDRTARGAFFAGASEMNPSDDLFDTARRKFPDMDFTPESLCQLGCNAIKYLRNDLLELLLSADHDLTTTIHRFGVSSKAGGWEDDELSKVSHRVIDMLLETALIWNRPESVLLTLGKGADPNIPIWQLERSYNMKYSALGYAISEDYRKLAEILLDNGASVAGIQFSGANHELYLAIEKSWDDLAEQMIFKGAKLSLPLNSELKKSTVKSAGSEYLVLGPRGPKFFGHFKDELEWVHNIIGRLITLAPIEEKQAFFWAYGQGGKFTTIFNKVVGNLERLKRYETLGLDTRLTAEEFCTAVNTEAYESLSYLLSKYGDDAPEQVFAAIKERKEFEQAKNQC